MSRWKGLLAASLLILGALPALPARADVHPNTAPGFPGDHTFSVGDFDNVNLFNGGLTLTIPIGTSYPVNGGFSYNLKLVYNGNPWLFQKVTYQVPPDFHEVSRTAAFPNSCSNAGLGWRVSLGLFDPPCQVPDANEQLPGPIYQDENGTDHVFYPTLHAGDAEDAPIAGVQDVQYTRDGSYLRLKVKTDGTREVEFPDGTVRRFDAAKRLVEIHDPFGNNLTVNYDTANQWVLTDSQNRVHRIYFRTDLPSYAQVIDHIDLAAFGGTTAPYQFSYAPQLIGRACPHNDNDQTGSIGSTVAVPLLTGVTLPDGSVWKTTASDYVITLPGTAGCTDHAGNLTALTLPTLGRMEWVWQRYYFPTGSSAKPHLQSNSGIASRAMRNPDGTLLGVWNYASAPGFPVSGAEHTTTVTDPLGHRTINYFSTALDFSFTGWSRYDYSLPFTRNQILNVAPGVDLNLSRQIYNASGTLLRSEYVLYERDPVSGVDPPHSTNSNRRMLRSRTVYEDGFVAGVIQSSFDGLGHYRSQQTEGSFPGSNLRTHFGNYNPNRGTYTVNAAANTGSGYSLLPASSPWVLETQSFAWDAEGGATAYTDLCYAPGSATVVRKRVHRLDGATQGAQDLVTVYELSSQGNGNVTSESFYGGDAQAGIPTATGDPCTMALPASPEVKINHTYAAGVRTTSQYTGASFFLLDQLVDANTGLPTFSRDTAGLGTSYEFDKLGRLTWSKPDAGHDGWTEYAYASANPVGLQRANVTIRRRDNGSKTATIRAVNQLIFDYFGRLYQEQRRLPDGSFNKRETLYDNAGNKASVSEVMTGAATSKTTFSQYDPFGRPGRITPPDGAAHNITLTYSGTRQVDRTVKIATTVGSETAVTTTEIYDRHGRLLQVTEPSGDAGANVTTLYGYDVGNRLASVSTTAFVAGTGTVTQSRTFSYDRAGLLQSETHPELGSAGNGTTSYPRYDSRGKLLRKTDGGNDLTYAYDPAERLFQVRETFGAQRTLKSFSYAASNGTFTDPATGVPCTDYRQGKLTQQSRFNYVTIFGSPFKVELREALTYCGRGGRLSRRTLENWVNDPIVPNEAFVLPNLTYDVLGNVTSLGYPQCTHAACAAPSPRTVTFSYTDDLLTSVGVPGNGGAYASSISYHPNLMVNQVAHGNGLTDTYANDSNQMARPASITVTTPTAAVRWATGTYGYDGAGNIKSIGAQTFAYDKVSRLTTANFYLEPTSSVTLRTQTYTFDAFGNLQSISGNSARNTPTTSATNHLTAGTYGSSGSLTSWNGNAYEYDPFHLMWHYKTPSDEWVYLYAADDERAWSYKTDNTSLWTLRGPDGKVLREYTNNGTWSVAADSIYRSGLLLATETPQGTRHLHLDHLGTPRLISDALGNQTAYHVYYPFGEEATAFNQDTLRAKLTGHERDLGNLGGAGDDLDYMHARFCSPVTGRFLGIDIAQGKSKQPQSWNRYAYVKNNPLRYADVDGQEIGLDVNMLAVPNETPAQSMAMGAAAGGLAAGFILAPEALAAAAPISDTLFALGVKYQSFINFFRNLGAGLTDTPTPKQSISGDFERTFETARGSIGILADAKTEGSTLVLKNVAVYGDKAKASVGVSAVFGALRQLAAELQGQGYTTLVIKGLRYSGAKSGSTQTIIIDIAKLLVK